MARILIVDDDKHIVAILNELLLIDGHYVEAAYNATDAFELATQENFDLILTDILMPTVDGIEFIKAIRQNSNIPIVAMSGGRRAVTAEFNLDSAELLGVRAVLTKPFTVEQLREALQKAGF